MPKAFPYMAPETGFGIRSKVGLGIRSEVGFSIASETDFGAMYTATAQRIPITKPRKISLMGSKKISSASIKKTPITPTPCVTKNLIEEIARRSFRLTKSVTLLKTQGRASNGDRLFSSV